MKRFIVVCSFFLMIGLVACGSTSSSSTDDATLTDADVQNVGAALYNSQSTTFTDIMNQFGTDSAATSAALGLAKTTRSGIININRVDNCQVSGHITSTGDFNWSYSYPDYPATTPEPSAYIRGQLMQQVSDPTNNLYDCEQSNDLILDGTIYSQLTYDWTQSGGGQLVLSTDGTIGLNRRGPTGGLVMIASDCSIFFTVTINVSPAGATSGSASGTICGESYYYSF
ncbi:MAG: hypothetical protein ABH871_07540 [Pseudomonadota bacterium]